jgi:plastocyanin
MTRFARTSIAVLALAIASCGGTTVSTQLGTVSGGFEISAANLAFDRSDLVVPAGVAVGLVFENREPAPHNIAIYADDSAGQALFVGEIFSGPASRLYHLPALPAGTYFFRCDVHQDMTGSLVATP